MITIHKWTLQPGVNGLRLPIGAEVLTVQIQNGSPQLWAKVDTEQPTEPRIFAVVGTGHELPSSATNLRYIATVQIDGMLLVFHVFEATK
jgi:hypothetical protein